MKKATNDRKQVYIDTNSLLYYVNSSSKMHATTKGVISSLVVSGYTLSISSLVIDEFIHNFIRFQDKKISWVEKLTMAKKALGIILALPLSIIAPPTDVKVQTQVIEYMRKYSLRARDAYHLLTMKHNKIKMFLTFDSDFDEVFKDGLIKNAHEAFHGKGK